MPLINLTQEFLEGGNATLYDKIRLSLKLDIYIYKADSLSEIDEHFKQNPPEKISKSSERKSAYVFISNVGVKRTEEDLYYPRSVYEEREDFSWFDWHLVHLSEFFATMKFFEKIDKGKLLPGFMIKDETLTTIAGWSAGNSRDYMADQANFDFNANKFVTIPAIFLQYLHPKESENLGALLIKGMYEIGNETTNHKGRKKAKKNNLFEIIENLIQIPEAQPSY